MDHLEQLASLFEDFANPRKRIFVGYLLLSLLIGLVWLIAIRRMAIRAALAKFCDRHVFFSDSARADYKIFIINRIFTLFISPLLLSQIAIASAVYFALHSQGWIYPGYFRQADTGLVVALFSVSMFVADDFTKFLVHRWMHKWPVLWAIHKTHHSATTLTPITVYRVHPLEGILYGTRSVLLQGTMISGFFFLFGDTVDLYTIVGVNVLVFVFHVTGSNLRHSHINISYWPWLERIVISPAQHQLHHSIAERHYDKNFGAALAIWDWLFGSLHISEPESDLQFGLTPQERSHHANLLSIYLVPLREILGLLGAGVASIYRAAARLVAAVRTRPGRLSPQPTRSDADGGL